MRVLVTRPAREALRWVHELQQHGLDAQALPLIDIVPAPDEDAVRRAWDRLAGCDAVMFVSGNAVERFFMCKPQAGAGWPPRARAWAPGPGTRDALVRSGVPAAAIDQPAHDAQQFDSQSLWEQVGGQLAAGQRVLLVRGGDASGHGAGRDWIATQLAQRGVEVDTVVAYRRRQPTWTTAQLQVAKQGAGDGSVWLFSSSEAIANLRALLPSQGWDRGRAVATHYRIAQAATGAGFGVVCLSRPKLSDVVASIESIR